MTKEVADEYASNLADLTVNSKPIINMLTILAEENIDHADVIVETVEKHLEKVPAEIKLLALYLVDSIIKNVGGAYTTKFSLNIVNMFTRTFKQVHEKIRAQMFELRQTWHYVFPAKILYDLDVKVNSIDPAWPIQAQPSQSNIHSVPTNSTTTVTEAVSVPLEEDEKMRSILAKKEQELHMLQGKKVEMLLMQIRRQVEMAEKTAIKMVPSLPATTKINSTTVASVASEAVSVKPAAPERASLPVRARHGPSMPTNSTTTVTQAVSVPLEEDEKMRSILAKKEQELHMLQGKKVEMLLVKMRRQFEMAEKTVNKMVPSLPATTKSNSTTVASVASEAVAVKPAVPERASLPVIARLGPPVNKPASHIAPVSAALVAARRDSRLARRLPSTLPAPPPPIAVVTPNGFDSKTLECVSTPAYVDNMPDAKKMRRLSRDGDDVPAKRRRRRGDDAQQEPPAAPGAPPAVPTPLAVTKEPGDVVTLKELQRYYKEHYMRRNCQNSNSPEPPALVPVKSKISLSATASTRRYVMLDVSRNVHRIVVVIK